MNRRKHLLLLVTLTLLSVAAAVKGESANDNDRQRRKLAAPQDEPNEAEKAGGNIDADKGEKSDKGNDEKTKGSEKQEKGSQDAKKANADESTVPQNETPKSTDASVESPNPEDQQNETPEGKGGEGKEGTEKGGEDVVVNGEIDGCGSAKTCEVCATTTSKQAEGPVCAWKENACVDVEEAVEVDKMCTTESNTPGDSEPSDAVKEGDKEEESTNDDGGGSSFTTMLVFLVILAVGLCFGKDKILKMRENLGAGGSALGDIGGISSILSKGPGKKDGNKSSTFYQERVPLATAEDDEEWGWENSGDDDDGVELSTRSSTDDDLKFALGQSSIPSRNNSTASPTLSQAPKSAASSRLPVTSRSNSGGSWNKGVPSGPTSAPLPAPSASYAKSSPSMPAMQIKSLGKATTTTVAKKKKKKSNPEDDLFASMGLSAKPKFNKPKPVAATPTWKTATVDDTTSGKWDDDGDLDDLLSD